ncbi:MAG: hypothetical protein V4593_08360 [Pseudomonadota bacterium]
MTHFEMMLLKRLDDMTSEVGRLATAVGRLEERQIAQDDRLEELEKTPPPQHVSKQYHSRGRTAARDGGLVISGGAVSVLLSAVLNHFATAAAPPLPQPPTQRLQAPSYIEAPK